jgi:hypothetical protein
MAILNADAWAIVMELGFLERALHIAPRVFTATGLLLPHILFLILFSYLLYYQLPTWKTWVKHVNA